MTVTLRPAADADRPAIFNVHLRAVRETCSHAYTPQQIDAWTGVLSPDTYTRLLRKRVLIVAADNADIVGFGQLDANAGEVDAIYVRPDRQGAGIGRMLLAELERRAIAHGIRRLDVAATLNAAGFYERAGYAQPRPTVHRTLDGAELTCIRMFKRLERSSER